MISMLNKLTARPDRGAELVAAIAGILDNVEREPGTLAFLVSVDAADPDSVWVLEVFADAEAMRAHSAGVGHDVVLGRVRELLAGPMNTVRTTPTAGRVRAFSAGGSGNTNHGETHT